MTYSCGFFATPESTLEEASISKYDRICSQARTGSGRRGARDRLRLGWIRDPRGIALRLPRDGGDDLGPAVRAGTPKGSRRRARAPRRDPEARLPRSAAEAGPSFRQDRVDRDDRGRGTPFPRRLLRDLQPHAAPPRPHGASGHHGARSTLRALPPVRRFPAAIRLPRRAACPRSEPSGPRFRA